MTTRRAAMAKARQSRRPSRLGTLAGVAPNPDYAVETDAGFPGLLAEVWQKASRNADLREAAWILLTLDGRVPAEVRLRALGSSEEAAFAALWSVSWRDERKGTSELSTPTTSIVFTGELALGTDGRVLLRTPSRPPLAANAELVGGVIPVPWSVEGLAAFQFEVLRGLNRRTRALADCRSWLEAKGVTGRNELLDLLREAALRTAPFVLYQEDHTYTNFRGRNTLTGKTLWPGHPDCVLTGLGNQPMQLWSDHEVSLVVCLALLVASSGYARIEEANGTQLTLDHVAYLLERTRLAYNQIDTGTEPVAPSPSMRVADLHELAAKLRQRRQLVMPRVQLYREIHGALMHKIERVAGPVRGPAQHRLDVMATRLQERLPVSGVTLEEFADGIDADPGWLVTPCGDFATGLEALVFETVSAATDAFAADFAMSRGTRSLPKLIHLLRSEEYAKICSWEITEFYCCVVPARGAERHFNGLMTQLADTAWAISSRMQYNSWHFIAGDLPRTPEVLTRDFFVPPAIPDLAYYSDQHHHGHVAAKVRWSIRSPQAVQVLDRIFQGFIDLRLLRNDGSPFDEQDLLAAHRVSRLLARATTTAATLVANGTSVEVTAFDSPWHWETITGTPAGRAEGVQQR